MRFADRAEAGERLAGRVCRLLPNPPDRLQVLALPRGGVPVGRPIADRLGVELRVLLVRKLGVPGHEELAMGAIAAVGEQIRTVRNDEVIRQVGVDEDRFLDVWDVEADELRSRMDRFGAWLAEPTPGAPVVLVDDGLATGATMQAAVAAVRSADRIIVAVPVGSGSAVSALSSAGAEVICLSRPHPLIAVGEAFGDFHQLDDAEVIELLRC